MKKLIQTRDVVKRFVPLYAKGHSLDVGAGTAKYKEIIEKSVSSYKTSDVYDGPGVDYVEDIKNLSFGDNIFDTVFCFQVLEHVDNAEKATSEIYRVLKRGGVCIATAPFLIPGHCDPGDFRRFPREGFRHLFEKNNFKILEYGSYGEFFTVIGEFVKFLFLNPYKKKKHSRIKSKIFFRIVKLFYFFDKIGLLKNHDFYANVYIVAQKNN
ncbi:MAG: Methylase/methyltransferase [Candidatus Magasanikbacteria bacterium GW2011_GWA2_42_32]|uniref:Methylase/methyltransferase n=1 Tax=Candidatus Magasanikbacteria bacterium GW2011_GWA2_42_32 TaxID=1619039 RepID=A0A0G1CDC3_9BACT|nr:MAG: Methylase/methyltransferase [Candidatus Magasanikbacteria bacterium GW2011_GWA2_42_32]